MSRYVTRANLAGAFFENAAMLGEKPLLFHKSKGKWTDKNWDEVGDSVRRLAGALVAAGIKPRDRVLISAENRPEWAIADLAVMSIGAIVVPAYTTNTEDDHVYIMEHSGALIAITSGGFLASRVALAASRVQHMRMLITMDSDTKLPDLGGRTVHSGKICWPKPNLWPISTAGSRRKIAMILVVLSIHPALADAPKG